MRLDGVGRRYGLRGPWVLRDVTLDIPPGALVRVEGGNGSGKSTLLRVLAGVDRPTAGRLTGRPDGSTAYVPERFPAALPFPVLRYLTHMGALHGLPAAVARARAVYWLDRFGVPGHAATPLAELSKGTCQKVALAQALLADPGLLVLDEAWTGLDNAARATLDAVVRARAAAGATTVFVDHDPHRLAAEPSLVLSVDAATGRVTVTPRTPVAPPRPAEGGVLIEARGRGELPPAVRPFAVPEEESAEDAAAPPRVEPEGHGAAASGVRDVRLFVPDGGSDEALRVLLGAEPAWHVSGVLTRQPAVAVAAAPDRRAGAVAGGRRRTAALLGYQGALLMRSHRWLPPLLGYGAVMAIGVTGGQAVLSSLGYAAALLLPVTAWLVRVCVRGEPAAARACTAAAVGAGRAHAGALLTGLSAAALLGAAGTAVVAAVSGAYSDDMSTAVPVGPATAAGLLAAAVSLLLGTAVGALTNPPLIRGRGWSMLVTALGAGAVLLVSGSPAQAAVTGLVTGSRTGAVHYPLLPLLPAAPVAAAACWASCLLAARRGAPADG
jgi:ABC-type Mn2+/Zn2+ transport system ATPase subunit